MAGNKVSGDWKWITGILFAVLVLTLSYGVIYFAYQQILRQGANDPQIQMAEDYSGRLSSGESLSIFMGLKLVDIDKSLSPYVMVYDDTGTLKFSSARFNGNIPTIPSGVLKYTRSHIEDRVTWQPSVGVRQAIVVKYYKGNNNGFVVAGRSLREVEIREDNLTKQLFFLWVISVVVIILAELMSRKILYIKNKR